MRSEVPSILIAVKRAAEGEDRNESLGELSKIGAIALVSAHDLVSSIDELRPELIILPPGSFEGETGSLYRLLDPESSGGRLLAALDSGATELTEILEFLGMESSAPSLLHERARPRLSEGIASGHLEGPQRSQSSQPSTLDLIADTVRQAGCPVSATTVSRRSGLSAVTCRRYLKRLVEQGKVSMNTRYQSVGRPTNLYQWLHRIPPQVARRTPVPDEGGGGPLVRERGGRGGVR
ncbi:hypothetical protein ACWD7Y_25705 [Streptomyces drozdowiczii]